MNYLKSTVTGQRLDLVVSVGGPAAVFARKYRERLFPTTPLLETALDGRFLNGSPLSEFETAVAGTLDLGLVIDNLLLIRPETETVFAVIGTTDFETFWRGELMREFERFKGRVTIVWLHDLGVCRCAEARRDAAAAFGDLLSGHGARRNRASSDRTKARSRRSGPLPARRFSASTTSSLVTASSAAR